jgi:hypothetical protein
MSSCSGEVHISDYLTVLMNRFKFHLTGGCERTAEVRSNTFLDNNELGPNYGSVPIADIDPNRIYKNSL